jgi:monofunctional biosynthetic peptidoglycan transglycosylase
MKRGILLLLVGIGLLTINGDANGRGFGGFRGGGFSGGFARSYGGGYRSSFSSFSGADRFGGSYSGARSIDSYSGWGGRGVGGSYDHSWTSASGASLSTSGSRGIAEGRFGGIAAGGFGVAAYGYLTLPDVRPLAETNPTTTAFIELRIDEARLQGKSPRQIQQWINYRRISPHLKRAVLVAEDAAFWQHDGIDYDELQKSVELDWARGQLLRGASTITQQLAKNLFLSPSRNPARKLRELIITRRLEAELPKARILELYLNVIEWGDGIYGAEAAARHYFGVPAAALDPRQSVLLAAVIINPRRFSVLAPPPRIERRRTWRAGSARVAPFSPATPRT